MPERSGGLLLCPAATPSPRRRHRRRSPWRKTAARAYRRWRRLVKTLGLIGGIGWESTARYYTLINEDVPNRLGSLPTAKLVFNNIEFNALDTLLKTGHSDLAGALPA